MNQSNWKGALRKTTLRRTEPYKMLKRTTKPLRRRVLIEEGLRESHTKNQSKAEEATETASKSSTQGRKVPLKKNITTMKKKLQRKPP